MYFLEFKERSKKIIQIPHMINDDTERLCLTADVPVYGMYRSIISSFLTLYFSWFATWWKNKSFLVLFYVMITSECKNKIIE